MNQENLTDPLKIKHALERKLGYGAVQKVATKNDVDLPIVSNAISGRRRSPRDIAILIFIARIIECPVRGLCPDGTELDENTLAQER